MFTTSTTLMIVMLLVYGLLSTSVLVMTRGYSGKPNRMLRLAALVLPLISLTIEVLYHGGTELGVQIPRLVHDVATPLLVVGLYCMTKSHAPENDDRDDDVEEDEIEGGTDAGSESGGVEEHRVS